jgi:hypothetical protein
VSSTVSASKAVHFAVRRRIQLFERLFHCFKAVATPWTITIPSHKQITTKVLRKFLNQLVLDFIHRNKKFAQLMSGEGAPGPTEVIYLQYQPPLASTMVSAGGGHPMEGSGGGPPSGMSDPHGDPRYAGSYRVGPPPPQHIPGSYGGSYSSYPPPSYGNATMYSGPPPHGYHRGPPPPPQGSSYPSPYGSSAYGGYSASSFRHPPYPPPYGAYDYPPRGPPPPSSYGGSSPVPPAGGRAPSSSSPPDSRTSNRAAESPSPPNNPEKHDSSSQPTRGLQQNGRADSPETTVTATTLQPHLVNGKLPNHTEVERLRAAAATEITTEEVKPIQTDFHFFVKDHLAKYRLLAEEEVRKSLGKDPNDKEPLDTMLVNTNLNSRLMTAWEDLTREQRDAYMVKEEDDRRRFMEEDEIASRHCATLTARGKSPRTTSTNFSSSPTALSPKMGSVFATTLHEGADVKHEPESDELEDRDVVHPSADDDDHSEEKKTDEGDESCKRSAPTASLVKLEDIHESPIKKNKLTD